MMRMGVLVIVCMLMVVIVMIAMGMYRHRDIALVIRDRMHMRGVRIAAAASRTHIVSLQNLRCL